MLTQLSNQEAFYQGVGAPRDTRRREKIAILGARKPVWNVALVAHGKVAA